MRDFISRPTTLFVPIVLLLVPIVLVSTAPAAAQDRGPEPVAVYRAYLEALARAASLHDLSSYMPAEMTAMLEEVSEVDGAAYLGMLRQEAEGAPPGEWRVVRREETEDLVSIVVRGVREGSGAIVQLEGDLTLVREEDGWKLENTPSWQVVEVLPAHLATDAAPRPLGPATLKRRAGAYEPSTYTDVADLDGSGESWEGSAVFDPRGQYVLLANVRSGSINLLDVDGFGEVWTAPVQPHYGGVSFRADGRGLALLGQANVPEVLPLGANLDGTPPAGGYFFARPALSAAAAVVHGRVRWSDLAHHPAEAILALAIADHEDETRGAVVFQPAGDGLWLPGEPANPRVWDLDVEPIWITWAPTGDRLAWTSSNARGAGSSVHVREYPEGGRVLTLSHPAFSHPDLVSGRPVFSPDGRRVAAIGWDNVAVVWDANSGEVLASMPGIARLAFAPDGEHLLAVRDVGMVVEAGVGDRILVWRIGAPEPERALPAFPPGEDGRPRTVAAVAVSPNGRFLIAVSDAGDVRLWDAEAEPGSRLPRAR